MIDPLRALKKLFKRTLSSSGPLLMSHKKQATSTHQKCREGTSTSVLDLPPELVFALLAKDLELSSILAFALVSHSFYELAIPILNRLVIITPHNEPLFRRRIENDDPRNNYVYRIQLGRADRVESAVRWNVNELLPNFLPAFAGLRELDTCGGTFVKGWDGLDDIGQALGDRLWELHIKLTPPFGLHNLKVIFPHLRFLQIRFLPYEANEMSVILPALVARFPALLSLRLDFYAGINMPSLCTYSSFRLFGTETETHFPCLRSFHITSHLNVPVRLEQDDMEALSGFLCRHSDTFRVLKLPSWHPTVKLSPRPPLDLRILRASLALAWELAPSPLVPKWHVEELTLAGLISPTYPIISPFWDVGEVIIKCATRWPYSNVRILTLVPLAEQEQPFNLRFLPLFFPYLEELHLDFSETYDTGRLEAWQMQEREVLENAKGLRVVSQQRDRDGYKVYYKVVRSEVRAWLEYDYEDKKKPMPGTY